MAEINSGQIAWIEIHSPKYYLLSTLDKTSYEWKKTTLKFPVLQKAVNGCIILSTWL